ncbi:universal stress protein [Massilia sp. Mn16-1_5]|uniref:universal stress protein n=1 Tax=Massilia sp. Mn16-1_5 TaxID=2079199 RepID=UPI00109E76EE|nr:universal stress protein [Massilia sp. Mn16-1_5]THC45214.1 hypothetical protein C2862_05390 [Massilia sp. Mn16-1_5]
MLHGILVATALSGRSADPTRTDTLDHLQAAPGWSGLVVQGWHAPSWLGRLRNAWSFGAIARRTSEPVLVLRNRAPRPYARVLVAVDFSDAALETVRAAARCAPGARFTLLHPLDTGMEGYMRRAAVASRFIKRHRRRLQAEARAAFRRFVYQLRLPDVQFALRMTPHPERVALRVHAARENPDLVVVRKPQDGLLGRWLGISAAREALAATRCDLLLVTAGRGLFRPRSNAA